jgi:serine/threonine protein kinase
VNLREQAMTRIIACPDPSAYQRLATGELPPGERSALLKHLIFCDACRCKVATITGGNALVQQVLQTVPVKTPAGGHATSAPALLAQEVYAFLEPPLTVDELGRLAHYRVLCVLGVGGMGMVFGAEDTQLQRPVAIKTMLPSLTANEQARQRFMREARAAAALKHDHIVTIYQVSEHRGVPYLAMELLEGESLEDRLLREGKLTLAETVRIGRATALALAAAHQRGLVHRDIKPANLWLEAQEVPALEPSRVKLLDFGLAQPLDEQRRLTQHGMVMGTPAYMSPEQGQGQTLDGRSDLFSLGCLLYHLATGQLPFQAPNAIATLVAITMETPQLPSAHDPTLPPAFCDLVMQMLAKDPDNRPPSAQAVAQALLDLERGGSDLPRSGEMPARAPAPVALTVKSRPIPRPTQPLAEFCLFTVASEELLHEVEMSESVTEFRVAGKPWLGPHEFLFKAQLAQRVMPILFALPSGGNYYWGLLTNIELEKAATRLSFEGFEKLTPPRSAATTLTRWTGQPLEAVAQGAYSLCVTPPFLLVPASVHVAAEETAVPAPEWPAVPRGSWLDRLRSRRADETAGENWEISGHDIVSHLLLRRQQQEDEGTTGSKDTFNLDLAVHAIHNPEASAALPALLKILKGKDVLYRCIASECLRHIGPSEAAAVDFLIEKLKDSNREVRAAAVQCLLQIGPAPQAAIPLLIEALRDDEEAIRAWAVACLRKIGPPATAAIDGLLRAMQGTNAVLRVQIIAALAAIGGSADRVVPSLMRALEHKAPEVRGHAVKALASYGSAATPALPALAKLLKSETHPKLRALVSAAAARIQGKGTAPGSSAGGT